MCVFLHLQYILTFKLWTFLAYRYTTTIYVYAYVYGLFHSTSFTQSRTLFAACLSDIKSFNERDRNYTDISQKVGKLKKI